MLQGLSPVLTKMLLQHGLSSETVVTARYLLAVLVLLPFGVPSMGRHTPSGPPRPRDWAALLLVGALGSGVGALLFTAALKYSSAGIVNSISKTAPIFVAFLGYLTLRERISTSRLLLVGAMVGADLLIGVGELAYGQAEVRTRLLGDLLALLAGITRATSEILAKGALRRFAPSTVTLWRFLGGLFVTGGVALYTNTWRGLLQLGLSDFGLLLLLGVVCTAVSMYLYYRGTAAIPVHVAVSLRILGAIVTVVLSWVILGETLNLYHVMGMGLLISGAYLLVLRTAREEPPPGGETRETAAAPPTVARPERLRVRLTLLISAFLVATVALSTGLSVRHANQMVQEQTRLTMGKVAAVLVQLANLEDPPSRQAIQQYLSRVVRHRIENEAYSVEIVYIAMIGPTGGLVAFALNEDLALVDANGNPYRVGDADAVRRLLAMADNGQLALNNDIIPVSAVLTRPGDDTGPLATVEIGCKRSIANRVIAESVARSTVMVLLLTALGVLLAARSVRRFTHPIERIAAAMQRMSGGELDLPLYSEGHGEIRQIGESLQTMRDDLQMGGAVRQALVRYITSQITAESAPAQAQATDAPFGAALLFVEVPRVPSAGQPLALEALSDFVDRTTAVVLRNDGQILTYADGFLVVRWPTEGEEDLLWAVLASQSIKEALSPSLVALGAVSRLGLAVATVEDQEEGTAPLEPARRRALGQQPVTQPGAHVLLSERVALLVDPYVVARRRGEEPVWQLVGLAEEPPLEDLGDLEGT